MRKWEESSILTRGQIEEGLMRKFILFIVVLAVLGAGAFGGRKVYRSWRAKKDLELAKASFKSSDFKKGSMWLRKSLGRNPDNPEGVRLMGDLAELTRSPSTVFWRERLVELESGSASNRFLLARAAMMSQSFDVARKALDGVDEQGKKLPDYFKFYGALAAATGQKGLAETNLLEVIRLQPTNTLPQLSLAVLRLSTGERSQVEVARKTLEQLKTDPMVRVESLRQLTMDSVRYTNFPRALAYSSELIQETNSVLNDRLVYLDLLRLQKSPKYDAAYATAQGLAGTNAAMVFELGKWALVANGSQSTLEWLGKMPAEIRTNMPVALVVADGYMTSKRWPELQAFVAGQNWGESENLRLAMNARALREQNLANASKADWAKAVKESTGSLDRMIVLERVAASWAWTAELEEVLTSIVNRFPGRRGESQRLQQLLYYTGKTRSLLTLYAQFHKSDPNSLEHKNNLAALALLLNAEEYKPQDLAKEVYSAAPTNPSMASTYAFALAKQGKFAESLQVFDKLTSAQLEEPSMAAYYGYSLAKSGNPVNATKATKYLDIASKGRLLPEEMQLVQKAR